MTSSGDETLTPAVLKEALETMSETKLLPKLESLTISFSSVFAVACFIPDSHHFVSFNNQQTLGTGEDLTLLVQISHPPGMDNGQMPLGCRGQWEF